MYYIISPKPCFGKSLKNEQQQISFHTVLVPLPSGWEQMPYAQATSIGNKNAPHFAHSGHGYCFHLPGKWWLLRQRCGVVSKKTVRLSGNFVWRHQGFCPRKKKATKAITLRAKISSQSLFRCQTVNCATFPRWLLPRAHYEKGCSFCRMNAAFEATFSRYTWSQRRWIILTVVSEWETRSLSS